MNFLLEILMELSLGSNQVIQARHLLKTTDRAKMDFGGLAVPNWDP
jgi:hypothetical protein